MLSDYVLPFPKVVRIEPAGACNLRCSHCPTGTVRMERGIMQPNTFATILETLQRNVQSVQVVVLYHGGEPLLNREFVTMVRQIKQLGIPFVKTVSNGMLLTESISVRLIESGLDAIEFSLDAGSPEQNNLIRRNSDYQTVVQNIKTFIDAKKHFYQGVEGPQLQDQFPRIYISSTQFLTEETYQPGVAPSPPEYLVQEFSGAYEAINEFKCTWAMRWPHMEVLDEVYNLFEPTEVAEPKNHCDHVINTMTVRWNGDVVACCYDLTSQYVLGNIHQASLEAIWNNEKYLKLRQSIHDMDFISPCATCNVVKPGTYLTLKS